MEQDGPPTQPEPFRDPAPVYVHVPLLSPSVFFGPHNNDFFPLLGPEGDPDPLPSAAWRDPRKRSHTPPSPVPRRGSWLSWWRGGS